MMKEMGPGPLTDEAVKEYINSHRSTWAVATTSRKIASIRKFGKWGDTPLLTDYRAPSQAAAVPHPLPEGVDGVVKMVEAANKPAHRALIALCGLLGLRVSEALRITPAMFVIHGEQRWLTVTGKGDKKRFVPVASYAWHVLQPQVESVSLHEPICPMHERPARRAISRIGEKALGHHVASHDLRATFGTEAYYRSGQDIRAVQELLGHTDSKTTQRYTQVREDAMIEAVDLVLEFDGESHVEAPGRRPVDSEEELAKIIHLPVAAS